MTKVPNYLRVLLAAAVLGLVSLACNLPRPGPEIPQETIPVTTQAVEEFQKEIERAATQALESGVITLEVSEAELTSLVAFELQDQDLPPMQNVQIFLRDGQMLITGSVLYEEVELPIAAAVTVSIDAQGQPDFTVTSATVGPVALPEGMAAQISDQLSAAFEQNVRPRMGDVTLQSITIADGVMLITGQTR